jgi:C4-dicarboxylate-specific signal transduction histidine kinase
VAADFDRDLAVQNSQNGSLAHFSAQTMSIQVARQEPVGERRIEHGVQPGGAYTGQEPSSLEENASSMADLLALLALLDEAVDHQHLADDLQQQERQVLYQLAATGMAAERVAHEFARHVQEASTLLQELRNVSRGNGQALRTIAGLEASLGGLRNEVRTLAPYDAGFRTERTRLLPVMEPIQTATLLNRVMQAQMGIMCEVLGLSFDIAGRPASLVQVFGNVLENACFWLERWSGEKKIRVILNPQNRTVSIEDTGPGVAPELAERVFLPGVSMRTNGRGLGLYIAQELLETMRARIDIDQSYRAGARFVISFPGSIVQSQRKGRA